MANAKSQGLQSGHGAFGPGDDPSRLSKVLTPVLDPCKGGQPVLARAEWRQLVDGCASHRAKLQHGALLSIHKGPKGPNYEVCRISVVG